MNIDKNVLILKNKRKIMYLLKIIINQTILPSLQLFVSCRFLPKANRFNKLFINLKSIFISSTGFH